MKYPYHHAALGGTFDHLHAGHEKIIDAAFQNAEKVSIGITDQEMTKGKKLANWIEPLDIRRQKLETYLKMKGYYSRSSIFILKNIFGTTLEDSTLDCIVVTAETRINAEKINNQRIKKGHKPLHILEIEYKTGPDRQNVQSNRIRKGEIDRCGFPYSSLFSTDLTLPDDLRNELRKPLGTVIKGKDILPTAQIVQEELKQANHALVISVGDIITKSLKDTGYVPDLSIIDFKTKRKKINTLKIPDLRYINQPGSINAQTTKVIYDSIEKHLASPQTQTLCIEGEEDLLALPAILLSPLHSVVLYGLVDEGVVFVKVTEDTKQQVEALLKQFRQ